jgi:YHS domain-containing protein
MFKHSKILALFIVFAFVFVLTGIAQTQTDETVVCPVSGKEIKKSEAKGSYEHKGKTYYFCCEGCKEKFIKNPEKHIQKKAEKEETCSCPMCSKVKSEKSCQFSECGMMFKKMMTAMMHMHGKGRKHGHMMHMKADEKMCCPLMSIKDADVKVENLDDGVTVRITSKNADVVKKIQETAVNLKAGSCCEKEECCKKEEEKVEKK